MSSTYSTEGSRATLGYLVAKSSICIQWVVARRCSRRPAWASTEAPEQMPTIRAFRRFAAWRASSRDVGGWTWMFSHPRTSPCRLWPGPPWCPTGWPRSPRPPRWPARWGNPELVPGVMDRWPVDAEHFAGDGQLENRGARLDRHGHVVLASHLRILASLPLAG